MPRSRKRTVKEKVREILGWLRAIGFGSTVLGGVVLTQTPEFFHYSVGLVYIGIVLIGLDLYFEPFFERLKLYAKIAIGLIFVIVVAGFSKAVVFVKSPLDVSAFMTDAEYPAGEVIAGIKWRPEFTELQVRISNPSGRPYDDLNIVIRPTSAVAAIAQDTNIPDVSFEDKNGFIAHLIDTDLIHEKSTAIHLDLLATDAGYRVRCGHLPAHTTIRVIMALADIKWCPSAELHQMPLAEQVRDPRNILRFRADDFSTYWKGHLTGDVYASRPTSTEFVQVDGDYIGAQRIRHITQHLQVGGKVSIQHR